MGIRTKCPNGHVFHVKEKYAGKKGFCPLCQDKVVIYVPDFVSTTEEAQRSRQRHSHAAASSESVFDEDEGGDSIHSTGESRSVLTDSVIRHKSSCNNCGAAVPMWYAKCPDCGTFMDQM